MGKGGQKLKFAAGFKPRKNPRYLWGQERLEVIKTDLIEYNKHLYSIYTTKARVDTSAPKFYPEKYFKIASMEADKRTMRIIAEENKDLVKKINYINKTGGKIDTFNKIANTDLSRWKNYKSNFIRINKENKMLSKRLAKVKTNYPLSEFQEHWKYSLKKMKHFAKYPLIIANNKTADDELKECTSISPPGTEKRKDRPRCWLEFKIDNGIKLGKIYIELYSDVVPKTAENFLAICRGEINNLTYKNCPVHKIYIDKFCAMGDITKFSGKGGISIYGDSFKAENYSLLNTRPGVLSMICFEDEVNSQFYITFKEMPELAGKCVVFGKVIRGAQVLKKVNRFGTAHGFSVVKIIISDCGVIINPKKYKKVK